MSKNNRFLIVLVVFPFSYSLSLFFFLISFLYDDANYNLIYLGTKTEINNINQAKIISTLDKLLCTC